MIAKPGDSRSPDLQGFEGNRRVSKSSADRVLIGYFVGILLRSTRHHVMISTCEKAYEGKIRRKEDF
jgi:hypothetical protein